MKKIDWKSKLTSRKFWVALASFITMVVTAFGGAEELATKITALVLAAASVIAYIIGEGLSDAAHTNSSALDTKTDNPEIQASDNIDEHKDDAEDDGNAGDKSA